MGILFFRSVAIGVIAVCPGLALADLSPSPAFLIQRMEEQAKRLCRSSAVYHYGYYNQGSPPVAIEEQDYFRQQWDDFFVIARHRRYVDGRSLDSRIWSSFDGMTHRSSSERADPQGVQGLSGGIYRGDSALRKSKSEPLYIAYTPWLRYVMPQDEKPIYELLRGHEEQVEVEELVVNGSPVVIMHCQLPEGRYEISLNPACDFGLTNAVVEKSMERGDFFTDNQEDPARPLVLSVHANIDAMSYQKVGDHWAPLGGRCEENDECTWKDPAEKGMGFVEMVRIEDFRWLDTPPDEESYKIDWPAGTTVWDYSLSEKDPIPFVSGGDGTLRPSVPPTLEDVMNKNLVRLKRRVSESNIGDNQSARPDEASSDTITPDLRVRFSTNFQGPQSATRARQVLFLSGVVTLFTLGAAWFLWSLRTRGKRD